MIEFRSQIWIAAEEHLRFQAGVDLLLITCGLESLQHFSADFGEQIPRSGLSAAKKGAQLGLFWKKGDVHTRRFADGFRQILPNFFRGKNQNGRDDTDKRAADFVNRGLRGAPRNAIRRFCLQAIL